MSKNEQINYITELSNAGVVNIEAAVPYLVHKFPELTESEAKAVIKEWINSKMITENKGGCGCGV